MIAALTLLTLAVAPPRQIPPATAVALEDANARWHALSAATSTFVFTQGGRTVSEIREAREGERSHWEVKQNGEPLETSYTDGRTAILLNHAERSYRVDTLAPNARAQRRKELPQLPPIEKDHFQAKFDTDRGLVLRADYPMALVGDEAAQEQGAPVRRIAIRGTNPYVSEEAPGGTISLTMVINRAGGWLRRAEMEYVPTDGSEPVEFRLDVQPTAPKDEPYTLDVASLKGWTEEPAPASVVPESKPIVDLLERSNRRLYDLPEVLWTSTYVTPSGEQSIREARRGTAKTRQTRKDGLLVRQTFRDAARDLALDFDRRMYAEQASTPRRTYAEALRETDEVSADNSFTISMDSEYGFRVLANRASRIVSDGPRASVDGAMYRRVRLAYESPAHSRLKSEGEWFLLLDATGLLRRAEGEMRRSDGFFLRFRARWDPKVPADEPFTFDLARLKDWKRAEPGMGPEEASGEVIP